MPERPLAAISLAWRSWVRVRLTVSVVRPRKSAISVRLMGISSGEAGRRRFTARRDSETRKEATGPGRLAVESASDPGPRPAHGRFRPAAGAEPGADQEILELWRGSRAAAPDRLRRYRHRWALRYRGNRRERGSRYLAASSGRSLQSFTDPRTTLKRSSPGRSRATVLRLETTAQDDGAEPRQLGLGQGAADAELADLAGGAVAAWVEHEIRLRQRGLQQHHVTNSMRGTRRRIYLSARLIYIRLGSGGMQHIAA